MSKVAVLKTSPETVIQDYRTLLELAAYDKILPKKEILLKLNLSWSLYFPSCSTQPWQLDGVLNVLKDYTVLPVENKTVVTDPWKGIEQNKWSGVLKKYDLTFQSLTDVKWVTYKPNHKTPALDEIFPGGFEIPEMFKGKQIVHLPTVKCVHPETEIFFADGKLITIKECVDTVHDHSTVVTKDGDEVATFKHDVISLGGDGCLHTEKAYQFWKTPAPETIIEVKTETGKIVKISKTHPFLTPDGWKMAENVRQGHRIAIPRRIQRAGKTQKLPELPELIKVKGSKSDNWDTIPVDLLLLRKVRKGLGLTQRSSGTLSVTSVENGHKLPTREVMNAFIQLFESLDKKGRFKKEITYMKFLASDDIAWDHVEEVAEIECDVPWLYDLTVENTNNFIGNGVIVHNTHGHTVTTGAMKNAFGGLLKEHRHHSHKLIHEVLVDLLKVQKEIHPSVFAVMDGTVCGDGAGPRTLVPACKGFILASDDQVAIDAVSAKLMGFDPLSIQYIKQAHEERLGMGDVNNIEILGEDISDINFKFQSKKSPVIFWDQMLRQQKLSFLETLIFHTPLFIIPIALSKIYHDYIWYPTVGKKRIRDFSETEWGKLFEEY